MSRPAGELEAIAARGIELCKHGEWEEGLRRLKLAAEGDHQRELLPGTVYAYLGYALARCEDARGEGLALCQYAVRAQFFEPDNWAKLALVHLLLDDRESAVSAVRQGLQYGPRHPELRRVMRWLGIRQRPVLPFLHRRNFVNQLLGRVRARLGGDELE